MENKNGFVDVSCFLLVEDSGDSEADYEPVIAGDEDGDDGDEGDDAESCCYNVREIQMVDDFDQEAVEWVDYHQELNSRDEPSWRSCKMWCIDAAEQGEEGATFDVNGRSREVMDGMEDRLFWETCMAVGYP
ncbi:hypothetical protein SLEP1_g229 [Rubroshorea leprosula]|uniref:Uncharacterized protein n=1 Tax=Rubroshorea leprosula TaxID=152421 RepID=A0AAV5HIR9_9ROSI|nr:hypothetical protein SLEP1_g229 [Rubroshorea leprosula]